MKRGNPLRIGARFGFCLLGSILASASLAATFTVTTTADSGPGSLRQAILDANANAGFDVIEFTIPGGGVHTIRPTSALPTITEIVAIAGLTQPGAFFDAPKIEISGELAPAGTDGLRVMAQATINALVINRFASDILGAGGNGMVLENADSSLVEYCLIGTNPTGTIAVGNGASGIAVSNSSSAVFNLCVISGNGTGVIFSGDSGHNFAVVANSKIGTDVTGNLALGNTGDGVVFSGGTSNSVQSCVVSGNGGNGVSAVGTASNPYITGNRIGVNSDGTAILPNGLHGVLIDGPNVRDAVIGSGNTNPLNRNLISGNLGDGVRVTSGQAFSILGTSIYANDIGLDATGQVALGNGGYGIHVVSGTVFRIGAPSDGQNNVISGNGLGGIDVEASSDIAILANLIGTNAAGTAPVPNAGDGIRIGGGSSNIRIGFTGQTFSTVISGNVQNGIRIADATSTANVISATFVGTGSDGLASIPNGANGVLIESGSNNQIQSSILRFNMGAGVAILAGTGNRLSANRISANGGLGIDLAPSGVTPNDSDDSDTGANQLQNFPVLASASAASGDTHVLGSLTSAPSTTFRVEFYANAACDGSGNGEGQSFLGFADVGTDASGIATIDAIVHQPASGAFITATATDPAGNTSEFSPCVVLPGPVLTSIAPTSGPASGGTTITLTGMQFQSTVTVTVGGVAATSPAGVDDTHATAVTPALGAGLLYDVTLTNLDGLSGTLTKGWLADFTDVPGSHPFHNFVEKLVRKSVTAGCGGGLFCVNDPVTRAQVAVLLLRSHDGPAYVPPPATGTVFTDVPANGFAAAWIEELSRRSVTAGCGGGNYCPTTPITRAQMSVFLLRMEHGPAYVPPNPVGLFGDVPTTSGFARWVEQLFNEGITGGCGGGNFCPDAPNTRGQMAVFLVTTFAL